MNSSLQRQTHMHNITLSLERNAQQGSAGEGGSCVGPRVDLPLHCYLLLRHKGALWRAASGRKARRRMSRLELHREEDPRLSPMTTLSSMNTIYATGSVFSNRPPPPPDGASSSPRALATFTGTLLVFCVLILFFLSFPPFFFYRLNQEKCSPSIANWLWRWTFITWWLEVCMVDMWEWGSVLGRETWAPPQGHHYDHTLCQCHGGRLLHTSHRGAARKLGQTMKITQLTSRLAYRCNFIAPERKLPMLVVFIL